MGAWATFGLRGLCLALLLSPAQGMAQGGAGAGAEGEVQGTVLDRVVAVVEDELITQSQLELEARISFIQRGGVQAAVASLDDPTLGRALELSIAQRLQTKEADRLNAFQVEPAELEAAFAAFRARFEPPSAFEAFLTRHETDASSVAAVIARGLRAEKILDSKIRLRAQVTETDVRQAYERRRGELQGTYEEARPLLREQLYRENYQRLARAELEQLQKAARVRRVAPYAQKSAGEARP